MSIEQKTCQNCKSQFEITPNNLGFYEKVKVPTPTFCPDCRAQRRMVWRCERYLYKRNCDLCKKPIISIVSIDKPFKVYCHDCFHGDKWNPYDYGMDVDFSRPFLEQLKELQLKVPRQYAFVFQNVNSDYSNGSAFNKNCYLVFVSDHNEDCSYSYSTYDSRSSMDLLNSNECELCYEDVTCKKSYRTFFSQDCSNSQDLMFCKNLVNCHDCIGSANLRNAGFCIFNEQYSKEEYEKKKAEMQLGTRQGVEKLKAEAAAFWGRFPVKYIHGFQNTNVVGDYTFNSKNTYRTYDSELLEDCKFINHGNKVKDSQDCYVIVDNSQNCYEMLAGLGMNNVKFGVMPFSNFDTEYTDGSESSHHLFGCCGLRRSEYSILNKKYSKEEYEALRAKIIEHMKAMPYVDVMGREYRYGEMFPFDFSPFAYNETVAQEYYPLTKEQALERGFSWKESDNKDHKITVQSGDIPDAMSDVQDSILNEVLGCAHDGKCSDGCSKAFKLTASELQFYKRFHLPLPALCFNCRHMARVSKRNNMTLYEGVCACAGKTSGGGVYANLGSHFHKEDKCPNKFQTTYPSNSKEIVYCEQCYQAEVA